MSNELEKADEVKPEHEKVVLEKQNYLRMMSTLRWLTAASLGLSLALTATTVKLIKNLQK